jgi:hypothetical protein
VYIHPFLHPSAQYLREWCRRATTASSVIENPQKKPKILPDIDENSEQPVLNKEGIKKRLRILRKKIGSIIFTGDVAGLVPSTSLSLSYNLHTVLPLPLDLRLVFVRRKCLRKVCILVLH